MPSAAMQSNAVFDLVVGVAAESGVFMIRGSRLFELKPCSYHTLFYIRQPVSRHTLSVP
jgi:hypothetical protein